MKILISPAKSLDFESNLPTKIITKPYFVNEANNINSILKKKSPQDIQKLMTISEKLAELNWERNQKFSAQEIDFPRHVSQNRPEYQSLGRRKKT